MHLRGERTRAAGCGGSCYEGRGGAGARGERQVTRGRYHGRSAGVIQTLQLEANVVLLLLQLVLAEHVVFVGGGTVACVRRAAQLRDPLQNSVQLSLEQVQVSASLQQRTQQSWRTSSTSASPPPRVLAARELREPENASSTAGGSGRPLSLSSFARAFCCASSA